MEKEQIIKKLIELSNDDVPYMDGWPDIADYIIAEIEKARADVAREILEIYNSITKDDYLFFNRATQMEAKCQEIIKDDTGAKQV